MRQLLFFIFIFIATAFQVQGQGCVAIRSNGASCSMTDHAGMAASKPYWLLGINSRFFKSYKHFVGNVEQKERVEHRTEVINHFFSIEPGLTRLINSRWSVGLFLPVISNVRSSKYEHYGNNSTSPNARRQTRSFGMGDLRLAVYYWLLDPRKSATANMQLSAGLKLPTGDYRYMDYFWKNDSTKILGPVDQSIQLGDGGTGISLEANSYFKLAKTFTVYFNGFYLINPREHNGVSTARGAAPSAAALAYGSDVMSVPDQYMLRLGANLSLHHFGFSAGARIEGLPAEDLIGGSNGFRRPGYVISLEPVASYKLKTAQLYLSIPYAIERNRTQSVPDKIRTAKTGSYYKGDAAFADYTVNLGVAIQMQ